MNNMKIINTGNTYRVYDNSMRTYDTLPAQVYNVCFDPNSGWFLQKYSDSIEIKEKIYGCHIEKVKKVLKSFSAFERNLGVILSGDKGIGKSLFSKVLSKAAVATGYPLIIVNGYIPGISSFIDSIDQECVILFDEFDKTFGAHKDNDPQNEMLTLFDGVSQGKKLFVVTCNSLFGLNDFLVNRPGRFHYHFRFEYPSDSEITEYMTDKLKEEFWKEISKVIVFAKKVPLNYDCLRAIAFELNCGLSFEEAIKDLNIVNTNAEYYTITAVFKDGSTMATRNEVAIDMFSSYEESYYLYTLEGFNYCDIAFNASESYYDIEKHNLIIPGDKVRFIWEYSDDEIASWDEKAKAKKAQFLAWKEKKLDHIYFKRKVERKLHYAV